MKLPNGLEALLNCRETGGSLMQLGGMVNTSHILQAMTKH